MIECDEIPPGEMCKKVNNISSYLCFLVTNSGLSFFFTVANVSSYKYSKLTVFLGNSNAKRSVCIRKNDERKLLI